MDPAFHSAIPALLGAATGALTSIATSWVAQRHQQRTQWMIQERARRERIFSEFIDQAAKAFADALSHMSVEDPSKLVPLYATIGRLRLFSSERTILAADAVMARVLETYYLPNMDFTSRPRRPDPDLDVLLKFTEACRAELGIETVESGGGRTNVRQGRRVIEHRLRPLWADSEMESVP